MLLSRVADGLYWIARYLERAEHTARVIEVGLDIGLGTRADRRGPADRLFNSLGIARVADALFDPANLNSVAACVTAARDNGRQVREEISSDMWEQLNALFLTVRQLQSAREADGRSRPLCRTVIAGLHLFQGITDATMGHAEGWQYLQVGRFLERVGTTASLVDRFLADGDKQADGRLESVDWVALLRSCSALEAYCRHYTADVRPERVTEFLLLSADFPRSVRFAGAQLESALLGLKRSTGRGAGGRVERLAGRLHASLDYGQVDEILADDPHAYLTGIGKQCAQIHTALYQTYISYAIESAIPA